jgi:hypothetical protein
MYRFADPQEVKELTKWCDYILHEVQNEVRDYFTFDIRLIGSGDKGLVTQNANEPFDLDYNLILQKDKRNLLNNPKQIKDIFISRFNKVLAANVENYKGASDSTPVITLKIKNGDSISFTFDIAIIVENNDGVFYRLTHDKNARRYIWNEVPRSADYFERVRRVKENDLWEEFRGRYLELKNIHLRRNDGVKSFSVFLETLNEKRFRG